MSPLTDARPRPEHLFQDGGKGGTGRDLEGEWGVEGVSAHYQIRSVLSPEERLRHVKSTPTVPDSA